MGYISELRELVGWRPLIMVGSAVIHVDADGGLLMIRRTDNGLWGLPGGALEPGETLEETARRELLEETGLVSGDLELVKMMSGADQFYRYPNGDEVYNVTAIFETKAIDGVAALDDGESSAVKRFPLTALPVNLNPVDRKTIDHYLETLGLPPTEVGYLSGIDLCFPELESMIEHWWRGHHPPGVPPHITLLAPWRSPITDADLDQLAAVVQSHSAFDITFESVGRFDSGFVYLKPQPNPTLVTLLKGLWAAFTDTPPYGGTIVDPAPHLTVTKALPGPELDAAYRSAQTGLANQLPVTLRVEKVSVLVAHPNGTWETRAELQLV